MSLNMSLFKVADVINVVIFFIKSRQDHDSSLTPMSFFFFLDHHFVHYRYSNENIASLHVFYLHFFHRSLVRVKVKL